MAWMHRDPWTRAPHTLALEPRIMFDAAGAATYADVSEPDAPSVEPGAPAGDTPRTEIVFIDGSVAGHESLLQDVDPNAEVVLLDADRDGVRQIAEALVGRTGIDAIHIVSHGWDGQVRLGTGLLFEGSLDQYASDLSAIGAALNVHGDIVFWGCDVANGEYGAAFVDRLAELTGADIAASTNDTGAKATSDWTLEYRTGTVEASDASEIFGETALSSFEGDLATFTVTNNADSGAGSFRQAILDANANGAGSDTITFSGDYTIELESFIEITSAVDIQGDRNGDGVADITFVDVNDNSNGALDFNIDTGGATTVNITGLRFQGITGTLDGAALAFSRSSELLTVNVIASEFRNNISTSSTGKTGGAIDLGSNHTLNIDRSIFQGNQQSGGSAAVGMNVNATIVISNSLFYDHTIGNQIVDAYETSASITLRNVTFADNSIPNVAVANGATYSAFNSILEQSAPGGSNNLLVGSVTFNNQAADDYALASSETDAIDQGSNAQASGTLDLAANTRIDGGAVDIGAYEFFNPNNAPVVDLNGAIAGNDFTVATYTENGTAVAIAATDATVTDDDADTINSFSATITNAVAGDRLTLTGTYGTISGADIVGSGTATLTITGTHSATDVSAALRAITFSSTSENPTNTARTIDVVVNDGTTNSVTRTTTVPVTPVNDAPVLANLNGDSVTFTEGDTGVALDSGLDATLSDVDSADLNGGALTLAYQSGQQAEDRIVIDTSGTVALSAGMTAGSTVSVGGNAVGTIQAGSTGGSNEGLVVTFTTADATPAAVQTLLRAIQYRNAAGDAPTDGNRVVRLTVTDGDGGTTGNADVTVNVDPVNDAPTLTAGGALAAVDEDTTNPPGAALNALGITAADVDGTVTGYAIVGNTANAGTQGVWQYSSNGTDWFAVGTVADDATALALSAATSVRFVPVADYNGAPPALTIRAVDSSWGGGFSTTAGTETRVTADTSTSGGSTAFSGATASITTSITAVNDAPTLTGAPPNPTINDSQTTTPFSTLSFGDLEGSGGTITIAYTAANGTLAGTGLTGTAGSYTLSGGNPTHLTNLLQALVFTPTENQVAPGNTVVTTFTLTPNDGTANGAALATPQVTATSVNEPAVIAGDRAFGVGEGGVYTLQVADLDETDPDDSGAELTWTVTTAPTAGTLWVDTDGSGTVNGAEAALGVGDIFTQQDVIDGQVTYRHDGGAATADSFAVDLRDGLEDSAGVAGPETVSITITATNDLPVLTGLDATPGYTEGQPAVVLDADVTVSDEELGALEGGNGDFAGASVTIVRNGGANANDTFSIVTGGSLTVAGSNVSAGGNVIAAFDTSVAGQVTVGFQNNGTVPTTALVNEVLQAIRYANASDDPPANVQLDWTFSDGNSANAQGTGANPGTAAGSVTVSVTNVNDAPTLAATGQDPTFTEGGAAPGVDLFSTVTASTVEAADRFTGLTLTVTNVSDGASEILRFDGSDVALTGGNAVTTATNALNVSVSVTGSTATVSFTGATLTNAQMQTLVDSLAYRNASENPTTGASRVVTITEISDNGGTAGTGQDTAAPNLVSTVSLTPVNDPPVVGGVAGETSGVVAGAGFQNVSLLDDAAVSNVDSADYDGGFLTIVQGSGTSNGSWGVDGTTATSGGDATIAAGETIAVGGVSIGTVHATDDGQGGNALRIDFNGNATNARVETLIQALTYSAPSGLGDRGFTLTLNDGDGVVGGGDADTTAGFTLSVTPNPPVIAGLNGDAVTYTEQLGPVAIDQGTAALVTDADSANFAGGNLTISIVSGGVAAQDVLTIADIGASAGEIGFDGTNVSFGAIQIGTIVGGAGGADLVVTLDADATPAAVTALVAALRYDNVGGETPTAGDRTIRVTLTDAAGGATSTPADVTVTVAAVDDTPTLGGLAANQPVTDKTTVQPFTGATIGDVDSAAVTVTVTLDVAAKGSFTTLAGFAETGAGTGVYSFTGAPGAAEAALRGLVFTPAANRVAPGATETTTFTVRVADAGSSTQGAASVASTSVNDAPAATGFVASQGATDTGTVSPFAAVTVSDPDTGQPLAVSVTLDGAAKGAFTAASLATTGFVSGGGGVYTLAAPDAATAQAALRGLVFAPADNRVPVGTNEVTAFTVSVSDGAAPPAVDATTSVVATSLNDAPAAAASLPAQTAEVGESFSLVLPAGLFSDPDVGDVVTVTVEGLPAGLRYDAASRTISGTVATPLAATFTIAGTDRAGARTTIPVAFTASAPPVLVDAVPPPPPPAPDLPPAPVPIAPPPTPASFVPDAPPPAEDFGGIGGSIGGGNLPDVETIVVPGPIGDLVLPRPSFFLSTPDADYAPGFGIRADAPIGEVGARAGGGPVSFSLRASTFVVEQAGVQVLVGATLADGSPLPAWVAFDPATGTFRIDAPPGFTGELTVVVSATLPTGESAAAEVRIAVEAEEAALELKSPEDVETQYEGATSAEAAVHNAAVERAAAGKPAFSEAVKAQSRGAWATQGQELLDSLIAALPAERPSGDNGSGSRDGRDAA